MDLFGVDADLLGVDADLLGVEVDLFGVGGAIECSLPEFLPFN